MKITKMHRKLNKCMKNNRSHSSTEMTQSKLLKMMKNLKTQQIVSLLSQMNFWPLVAYWGIMKTRWMREKQQVSKHTKKPYKLSQLNFCIINTWRLPKNEIHPKIDKFPLKPDKWYEKNTEITVRPKQTNLTCLKWRNLKNSRKHQGKG